MVGTLQIVGNETTLEQPVSRSQHFSRTGIWLFQDQRRSRNRAELLLQQRISQCHVRGLGQAVRRTIPISWTLPTPSTKATRSSWTRCIIAGWITPAPLIVQREIQIKPGDPLSQIDMLNTQKSLYDLGHLQPGGYGGAESGKQRARKRMCWSMCRKPSATPLITAWDWNSRRASRAQAATKPLGETGVSPRVSFGVTRLNFRGLNHTVTLKANVGRPAAARSDQLRRSALVQQSQLAPHLHHFLRQHGRRHHLHLAASGRIGAGRTDDQQDQPS